MRANSLLIAAEHAHRCCRILALAQGVDGRDALPRGGCGQTFALGLKPGTITLDADSTTCQTFGAKKKGTGWSHNGVRGYQPFVISWSERRRFLAADLLAANNNPVASSPRLLRRALTLLPDGADGVRLRGDSGFYSADLMAECAKKGSGSPSAPSAPRWSLRRPRCGDAAVEDEDAVDW